MKIKLLKKIRLKTFNKYKIERSYIDSCKPWHIACGSNRWLTSYEYATKEEAIEALKRFWHTEAANYLWDHRYERKHNDKYFW